MARLIMSLTLTIGSCGDNMSKEEHNRLIRTRRKESARWLDHLDLLVEPNLPNGMGRSVISWVDFLKAFPHYPKNIRK